jgi:hypothetical protein
LCDVLDERDHAAGELVAKPLSPDLPPARYRLSQPNPLTSLLAYVAWFGVTGAIAVFVEPGAALMVCIVVVVWFFARFAIWNKRAQRAFNELDQGHHERAALLLERMTEKRERPFRELAVNHVARLAYRRGDFRLAITLYSEIIRTQESFRLLGPPAGVNLAMCYALSGKLDAAVAWLPAKDPSFVYVPIARAIVFCLQGRYSDAIALEARSMSHVDRKLLRHEVRALELVRALALTAIPDQDGSEAALAKATPAYPGEYEYLAMNWPAMRALLQRRGIR